MKLLSFHGRMGRQTFFALTVLLDLIGLIFVIPAGSGILSLIDTYRIDVGVPVKDISDSMRNVQLPAYAGWILLIIGLSGLILVMLGLIGISVRRLHDLGLTGFFVLLLPALQVAIGGMHWPDFPLLGPSYFLWTLILAATPGSSGSNAFGSNPAA